MPRRALIGLIVALAAGVLVGSGLAGLSSPPPNDPCGDFGSLPEGSTSSGSLELWPLGNRCEYHVGSRLARTTHFGPTTAELYAWILAATLLAAIALRKRDSALARGTAIAALMLAISGAGWHLAGVASRSSPRRSLAFRWPTRSITSCERAAPARPADPGCSPSPSVH